MSRSRVYWSVISVVAGWRGDGCRSGLHYHHFRVVWTVLCVGERRMNGGFGEGAGRRGGGRDGIGQDVEVLWRATLGGVMDQFCASSFCWC